MNFFKFIRKKCPSARLCINTNGLATELIREKIKEILKIDKNVLIIISLDGIGKIHDEIRGIDGAYLRVINTIETLKHLNVKNLSINFTILDKNIDQMEDVYNLAKKFGIYKINYTLAYNSEFYYCTNKNVFPKNIDRLKEQLNRITVQYLRSFNFKNYFRAYFLSGIIPYIKYRYRPLPCSAGIYSLFIDCNGDIYPCPILNKKLGNLKTFDFKDIRLKGVYNDCPNKCWTNCTIFPLLRKKPYLALSRIIIMKLKALFGCDIV